MTNLLLKFSDWNPWKQFAATFAVISFISLVLMGLESLEPTAQTFALTFGPVALCAAVFVLFFRILQKIRG